MASDFLHGVELIDIDNGARPIRTVKSSVIGLVGTAKLADTKEFPLNTPVLIAGSRAKAAKLGIEGTLPKAVDAIFDQVGAAVVVVRVTQDTDAAKTKTNIIGGVDAATGQYKGIQALIAAESVVHVKPRVLIAPGFSHEKAVATELDSVAERLRAVAVLDGPNTNDAEAKTYAKEHGSSRLFMVDPAVRVWSTKLNAETVQPASARVAGLIAKSDNDRGFWWSPSNQEIKGIVGTARPVDFTLGDVNARANLLNEANIATIIQQNGYRLWGNRTLSSDAKYAFLNVRRTADMIADSIQRAHLWAVDRNITATYLHDVTEGVNNYLRELKAQGAIIDGKCWADPELNTPSSIEKGKVYFDFDFTPNYPAERVSFRQHMINDYLEDLFT